MRSIRRTAYRHGLNRLLSASDGDPLSGRNTAGHGVRERAALHDWVDDDPPGSGWVGLRTYDTDVTYDDWTVYRVE